jgi:hypothetical protein
MTRTLAEFQQAARRSIQAFDKLGGNAQKWEPWALPPLHPLHPLRKQRKARKPTLTAALRQARKAGQPVRAAEITAAGVKLEFGEPEAAAEQVNPWLADLDKVTRQ